VDKYRNDHNYAAGEDRFCDFFIQLLIQHGGGLLVGHDYLSLHSYINHLDYVDQTVNIKLSQKASPVNIAFSHNLLGRFLELVYMWEQAPFAAGPVFYRRKI